MPANPSIAPTASPPQLRRELGALVHAAVRDHALPSVSVSDVEVTRDLDIATVYVTALARRAGARKR